MCAACAGRTGPELHRARDAARDQSYFLFATTREELDFLRFPLGGLAKDETRALARRFGLPVADKPDSQDICFVPKGSYADLVERLRPGGRRARRHRRPAAAAFSAAIDGIAHFTVGQRKGLGHRRRRAALRAADRSRDAPRRRRPAARSGRDPLCCSAR